MSTPPPPPPPSSPPPPPPPPFGFTPASSPSWSRSDPRQQRRGAKLAARQQRAALRMQRRALRRTSIVGPLLLMSLGLLLFSVQLGHLSWAVVMGWLSVWWPLILVSAGVVLLVEWKFDAQRAGEPSGSVPRRTLGAGGVVLLFLLAISGAGVSALRHSSIWMKDHWDLAQAWGLDDWLAQHTEDVQQLQAPLSAGSLLTIEDGRGDVTITGSSTDGTIHVTARRHFWGWGGSDLERRKTKNRPTLTENGAGLLLRAEGEGRDQTDFTIDLPHNASLVLNPNKGELSISELRGAVHVSEHAGNIVLAAVTGDVQLSMHDDDASVSARSITGAVTMEGRSGDLTFSDIQGPLTLRGDFFGTTHLERIQGDVHFESSFTKLTCSGVRGELNVEGRSELEARDLTGAVSLTTTERDVTLSQLHGPVSVTDQKGSVSLSMAELTGPISAATTDGSLKLHVSESAAFRVDAETADGAIDNDFGLTPEKQDDRVSLTGVVQRGAVMVHLRTTEGDIALTKGAATPAAKTEKEDD